MRNTFDEGPSQRPAWHLMSVRDITWACSHCGATFSTREALTSHVVVDHGGHLSRGTPSRGPVTPSVTAVQRESSAKENRLPDVGQIRLSGPDSTAGAFVALSTVVPPDPDLGDRPPAITSCDDPRKPSIRESDGKPTAGPSHPLEDRNATAARRTLSWVAAVAICVAAVGLVVAFHRPIGDHIALFATRQPTSFTELYFNAPSGLPQSLSLSSPNLFGFTVVNHEGHATVYSYVVTLATSYGNSTIAQGRVSVRRDRGATTVINVSPTRRATEYLVTVKLVGRSESIWFRGLSQ